MWPGKNKALVERLAAGKVTAIAIDQVPRITRAQKMDALSSMANIAGYRAVIEAASFYGRFFTGQMTAAGRVPPAKVLVIGAGVAGLAAIGAARGLGAIVRAFDTRSAVRDQVKSMGAEFLEVTRSRKKAKAAAATRKEMSPAFIAAEMALFAAQAKDVDIIITTALIPNRPAPVLITEEMVRSMKKGSVIVDLAAENGGNCALTEPGAVVERHGVHIIGYIDLPSRLAPTASVLYGNNLAYLLDDLGGAANFHIDINDEVVRNALIMHDGADRLAAAEEGAAARSGQADATTSPPVIQREARSPQAAAFGLSGTLAVDRGRTLRPRLRGAAGVPLASDRLRAGLHRRLAGGLERDAGAAHAAHERHQRDQRHHRRRRHADGERTDDVAAGHAWALRPSCWRRSTSPAGSS